MADPDVLAHWYQRFDSFSMSSQEFYERLARQVARREMPDTVMFRRNLPEGGLLSAYRDYLHIRRGQLTFVLCAAPFGIDFFISWWLLDQPGCLSGCIAVLPIFAFFKARPTFYAEDTETVFRDSVHEAILETIDGLFANREKKPQFDRTPKVRSRMLA